MKIRKQIQLNCSADKAWKVLAHDFENAGEWMAAVPKSYAKDLGEKLEGAHSAGRVCELNNKPYGIRAVEKFLAYDEKNKTCTIEIKFANAPFYFPISKNIADISMSENGQNQSTVLWEVHVFLKPIAYVIWPLVRFGFSIFFGQIVEEFKYFVENGTPHPRKLKAMKKMQATPEPI